MVQFFNEILRFIKNGNNDSSKRVLITGFGAFHDCTNNPSWTAVKSMDTKNIKTNLKITLTKEPIAVRYVDVNIIVPQLLDSVQPHLTIHVGVSETVSCFVLEAQARKNGYREFDAAFRNAALLHNPSHGPDTIVTRLDIAAIQMEFNSTKDDLHAEVSYDAGRYLCEYIYYTSLSLDRCPTLFVHVPLNQYTTVQLARGLERILEICIKQLGKATDVKVVLT